MARTKLIIMSFNTDKYHDLITLFSPPPRSLEVNMSQSREEGKNSSSESFTKRSFRPEPEHLAMHSSDSKHLINIQLFLMIHNKVLRQ